MIGQHFLGQFEQIADDRGRIDAIFIRNCPGVLLNRMLAVEHFPELRANLVERKISAGMQMDQDRFIGDDLMGDFIRALKFNRSVQGLIL